MIDDSLTSRVRRNRLPVAVVLGTNEIASAVGVHLRKAGYGVVLSHDPLPPVIRRGMAFHDALFCDVAVVDGIAAVGVDHVLKAMAEMAVPGRIAVTRLGLNDLLVLRRIDVLVDARMQKRQVTPDFRNLAGVTVGLGPGFCTDCNCDVAVETRPARVGTLVRDGTTDAADGNPAPLGGVGRERFAYARTSGQWRTAFDIGARIYKGMTLGHLDGRAVAAPIDGTLRGLVRDDTEVPTGVKLLEIDPRGREARWTGIDDRGRRIALATIEAIATHAAQRPIGHLRLVQPTSA
jgi:xanthine dehydrogenase accessory factor